ncbi:unnamed protein product [marine sediment metagenome]|uniref:Uncharacterized protein n=1 Tax=marine sediment metagenome TaxID=412755 RepID=X0XM75_9ZZZZ
MNYFGTNLDTHGHYFWELDGIMMRKVKTSFKDIPFDPEELTNDCKKKGDTVFCVVEGYSILAINGSCKDTRPGTKSVFWVNQVITKEELLQRIANIPVARKMIQQMDFLINW